MARRALLIAAAVIVAPGCFDDLPEPVECPPAAQVPEGDCSAIDGPLTGCLPPEQHACFAGPRRSCACQPDECPADAAACYPPGDCPPEVVVAVGEGVRCGRVDALSIGEFLLIDPSSVCTCGCAACLSVCDGKGPTFGATLLGDGDLDVEDTIFPVVRLDDLLPAAGRMGVFLRTRSTFAVGLLFYRGEPLLSAELELLGTSFVPPSDGFTTHLVFDEIVDLEGRPAPLVWSDPQTRPTLVLPIPPLGLSGPFLAEVDCLVPFWVE